MTKEEQFLNVLELFLKTFSKDIGVVEVAVRRWPTITYISDVSFYCAHNYKSPSITKAFNRVQSKKASEYMSKNVESDEIIKTRAVELCKKYKVKYACY